MSDYLPIAEHGVIGDLHTVALVGTDGTIDWYCTPHFDSPSVFGAILDREKGGHYRIAPSRMGFETKQLYLPDTNVLFTRFLGEDGVGELQDFMPISSGEERHRHRLVRRVVCVRGEVSFRVECEPRVDYARADHEVVEHEHGVVFRSPGLALALEGPVAFARTDRGVTAELTLRAGETATFVLEQVGPEGAPRRHTEEDSRALFDETIAYWRRWISQSRYTGRWREMVHRSALTLKLLTYQPTGAIVAAPTTSLPEQLGGERNWDYRYTWIRDAAFSVYGLLRLGFTEEAAAFMDWITARFRDGRSSADGPL
ncbi:MAG TPA: trehalase-like domain-containing protein, partial [Planctomycetota bacterium]|nr:trehalase-like domain-containing protein [Planctomycetota bacterium]